MLQTLAKPMEHIRPLPAESCEAATRPLRQTILFGRLVWTWQRFGEFARKLFRASRVSIATNCPYCVAVRRSRAAFVETHAQRTAHGDSRAILRTNAIPIPAGVTAPCTLAAKSRAKPASYHYQPRKQKREPKAEAYECHTSSARVRDAFSDSILWPMFGESAQKIPALLDIRIHIPPAAH